MSRIGTWRRPSGKSTQIWPKSLSARWPGSYDKGRNVSRSPAPRRGHVPPHLVIAADVLLFVSQPPEELRRRVTLLARRLFVRGENRIDPLLVHFGQHPPRSRQRERVRPRLRLRERLADLPSRMPKRPGDLPNAHPIAMSTTYPAVILHLQHP